MEISVIIPAFNEEKCIETCLKAVRSQKTKANYEIIVADCRSEDKTVKIAEKYADKIVTSKKRSIGIARNTGAKAAKGKYLVFVDADTIVSENYLEKVKEKFSDPELLGFSAGFTFPKNGRRIALAEKFTNSYLDFRDKVNLTILLGFNTCVRRNAFEKIFGFRDVPLEDGDFGFRLRQKGKTRYFTDFFVVTSSRRLEEMGILGALRYYFEMDLSMRSPVLKNFLAYSEYVPLRISELSLEQEFFKLYRRSTSELRVDITMRGYIKNKAVTLMKTVNKTRELNERSMKMFSNKIIKTSKAIAEIKIVPKVTKKDVDKAIQLIREKIK